ncbi:MAG TPA: 50S ribosomal protein L25 [Anaerovoracaceae bacterium]|nr:50S ribosomal protein L25 [Anaerovoracaceae bacterium]
MNNTGVLNVETRDDTSTLANKRLRKSGYMPGNIYGKGMDSIAVSIRKDDLRKNIAKYGRSAVFEIILDGKEKYNVMVKEIQFTHVTQDLMHVDFHSISLTEETRANVPIRVVGDEMYVSKKLVLQLQRDVLPIRGLPQDVPNFIEINVEDLNPGDTIFIEDIVFPEGITSDLDETQLILSVTEAKVHDDIDAEEDEGLELEGEELETEESEEEEE